MNEAKGDELVSVCSWWDSGPFGGWSLAREGDDLDAAVAFVPRWLYDRYVVAQATARAAEEAVDAFVALAEMRDHEHPDGWVVDSSYDPSGDRPHAALVCIGCASAPAGHPPWNVVDKTVIAAWFTAWAAGGSEDPTR